MTQIASSPKKSIGYTFLKNGIKRILDDRDIKRKENLQLKKACECTLEDLKSSEEHLPDPCSSFEADRHFLALELACTSKSPEIVTSALDCLQKLIAYGYLTGKGVDPSNPEKKLIDRIVETICVPSIDHGTNDKVLLHSSKAVLEVLLSEKCEVHGESLILAVRTCFNVFLRARDPMHQASAEVTMKRGINAVFEKVKHFGNVKSDEIVIQEVVEKLIKTISPEEIVSNDEGFNFPNAYQEDAFLVFQELCTLAENDEDSNTDMNLRFKLLVLDIINSTIQTHSIVLQSSQPCIVIMKRKLCIALTQNATLNPNIKVFEKSCDLFVELLDKFKANLKASIEVFFKEIILPILVLDGYSFEQKRIVMKSIEKILTNPQSVVDMYVNYDLGLTSGNLFKLIVEEISKTTNMTSNDYTPTAQKIREHEMRLLGLSCLSNILQCLVDWWQVCEVQRMKSDIDDADRDDQNQHDNTESEKFESLKQQKNLLEQGIHLFSTKPRKGLKFLQDNGFVGVSAEEVAEFMMKEERLDKTQIGDFLGDPDEFNNSVMHSYVDLLDFTSMGILAALRLFLEKFRLPGEAQKVDRLMLKFASRYLDCNPNQDVFASADAAYVLAFSIILLTTDLHNKTIKNKITKEGYISMNRGINDGGNIPKELLESIFDDISKNEIKMRAGATALLKSRVTPGQGVMGTEEERRKMAAVEMEAMSQTARALMESASDIHSSFTPAQHQHHVKPMFEICWAPCLVAFSMGVQLSDDENEWTLCLKGLRLGVKAACVLQERSSKGSETGEERKKKKEAFIKALSRFTLLTAKNGLGEMKMKNIEAIKTLLLIGYEDGEYLEENWIDVMRCISSLELVQLIGTGLNSAMQDDKRSSRQYVMKATGGIDEETLDTLKDALGESFSQSVVVAIDRIFNGSSQLSSEDIVYFVNALCQVSREELSHPAAPRMFLLGKVVEVAFYNMNRLRFEWTKIWNVIGEHFNAAGCSPDASVAYYSIDALRQLSIKFLEKGELPNYRFQKEFLRPFEVIVSKHESSKTRDLVVQCCTYLVKAHSSRLRSGWQNIFSILTIASGDKSMEIVKNSFQTTSYVIEHCFKDDFSSILESFQDLLKCLQEFACNPNLPGKNTEAVRLIRLCASSISENSHRIDGTTSHHDSSLYSGLSSDQHIWLRGWLPIFLKLSCIINECNSDVRRYSLTVLFEILEIHGLDFQSEWWNDVFDIVLRNFDPSKVDDFGDDKKEWMSTTCNYAMPKVIEIFSKYFSRLDDSTISIVYKHFGILIRQDCEEMSRSAICCLESLIFRNGERFTVAMWEQTLSLIQNLLSSPLSSEIQLELIESVSRIILGDSREDNSKTEELFTHLTPQQLLRICDILTENQKSFENVENKKGSSQMKVETRSLSTIMSIVLRLMYDIRANEMKEDISKRVFEMVSLSFDGYEKADSETSRNSYGDVICGLLEEFNNLPNELLPVVGAEFSSKLCDLVKTVEGPRMRRLLSDSLRRFTTR
ncbi:unnamed protein product [Caenorhabditis brenneri]